MPCGADDLTCPGGQDWNGCQMPDTCQWMPKGIKYNCHTWYLKVVITLLYLHTDGTQCMPQCPATCAPDQQMCPKGLDSNQCPVADTCMPKTSKQLFPYKIQQIEKYPSISIFFYIRIGKVGQTLFQCGKSTFLCPEPEDFHTLSETRV
jgi:hypothetical protein